jgi:transmembrane sensor
MRYPTAREEQAAYWYLKLQQLQVGADEIQAALEWQSDPENRAAFDRVEAFWRAWPDECPLPEQPRSVQQTRRARWMTSWQAAAAAIAIVAVSLWLATIQRHETAPAIAHQYATAVGQIRTVWLEDGSEVILSGATSLRTDFSANVRRVVMSDGEALFLVAKDPLRPFIVDVPNGSARALGTTFSVHRGPDEATIAVIEGLVQVSPPAWRSGVSANLSAGAQVALSTDGLMGRIKAVNPQEIGSWQSGRLIFVDRTLRAVIADLNRYSSTPVTLAVTAAANVRISGNIQLDRIEEWLRALGPAFGIDLVHNEHGMVLVSRTGTRGANEAVTAH